MLFLELDPVIQKKIVDNTIEKMQEEIGNHIETEFFEHITHKSAIGKLKTTAIMYYNEIFQDTFFSLVHDLFVDKESLIKEHDFNFNIKNAVDIFVNVYKIRLMHLFLNSFSLHIEKTLNNNKTNDY